MAFLFLVLFLFASLNSCFVGQAFVPQPALRWHSAQRGDVSPFPKRCPERPPGQDSVEVTLNSAGLASFLDFWDTARGGVLHWALAEASAYRSTDCTPGPTTNMAYFQMNYFTVSWRGG